MSKILSIAPTWEETLEKIRKQGYVYVKTPTKIPGEYWIHKEDVTNNCLYTKIFSYPEIVLSQKKLWNYICTNKRGVRKMKIQLEQRLNLKNCPICDSNPLLSTDDMGDSNGRGYPGDFMYYFYCPFCQKLEGNSFTTVYTKTKEECIEKAAESWNEEVESWNKKILN